MSVPISFLNNGTHRSPPHVDMTLSISGTGGNRVDVGCREGLIRCEY